MWKALIAILEKLGCKHEWETIDTHWCTYRGEFSRGQYWKYLRECKKCRKHKIIKIKP